MEVTATMVKQLREKTGVGTMKCKTALGEAKGDITEAEKILRKQGVATAAKKASRATGEGLVSSYIHTGGKIGVLLEVNCETDFAARSDDFQQLVKSLSMHIAAAAPRYVSRDEVSEDVLATEREIAHDQALQAGNALGVLHGIPYAAKELFDVRGLPTTAGANVRIKRLPKSRLFIALLIYQPLLPNESEHRSRYWRPS